MSRPQYILAERKINDLSKTTSLNLCPLNYSISLVISPRMVSANIANTEMQNELITILLAIKYIPYINRIMTFVDNFLEVEESLAN